MLTKEDKEWIDNANYETLLRRWRFALPDTDKIFQEETGSYFAEVLTKKREQTGDNGVRASKRVGWKG